MRKSEPPPEFEWLKQKQKLRYSRRKLQVKLIGTLLKQVRLKVLGRMSG